MRMCDFTRSHSAGEVVTDHARHAREYVLEAAFQRHNHWLSAKQLQCFLTGREAKRSDHCASTSHVQQLE